jgi:hypothetical protein
MDRRYPLRFAAAALALKCAACYVPLPWQVAVPLAVVGTAAVVTAAVVSATAPPPPPRVVYVQAAEHPGYAWQPGYWTRQDNRWVWVEGRWIALQPGFNWAPTHWEQAPDGSWRLIQGSWVPVPPS